MKKIAPHLVILSSIFVTCNAMDGILDTSAPEKLVISIQAKLESLRKSQLYLFSETTRLVPGPSRENPEFISSDQERLEQLIFFNKIGWLIPGSYSPEQELMTSNQTEIMHETIITWLLTHFASRQISIHSFRDTKDRTALHIASAWLYDDVVRILLDPRLTEDVYTLLIAQDNEGNTAAHHLSNFEAKALNYPSFVENAKKCGSSASRICIYFHEAAGDKLNKFYSIRNYKEKTALD